MLVPTSECPMSEFKEGAVGFVLESGDPIAARARDLGVTEPALGTGRTTARSSVHIVAAILAAKGLAEREGPRWSSPYHRCRRATAPDRLGLVPTAQRPDAAWCADVTLMGTADGLPHTSMASSCTSAPRGSGTSRQTVQLRA